MITILFQGDSITDAGRDRENPADLGPGYPHYAAQMLREKYPQAEFNFVNRGISGDRTENLIERWEKDTIEVNPDIISILIGVNDTWHHYALKDYVTSEYFEGNYRWLLDALKTKTKAKILMMEPFLLPGEFSDDFYEDLFPKILLIRKLAREYADAYLPLDGLFAQAQIGHTVKDWTLEGIHPNAAGSEFLARHYVDAISPLIDSLLAK